MWQKNVRRKGRKSGPSIGPCSARYREVPNVPSGSVWNHAMTFRRYREVPRCAKCANWNICLRRTHHLTRKGPFCSHTLVSGRRVLQSQCAIVYKNKIHDDKYDNNTQRGETSLSGIYTSGIQQGKTKLYPSHI